jgi:hypothetical protein
VAQDELHVGQRQHQMVNGGRPGLLAGPDHT